MLVLAMNGQRTRLECTEFNTTKIFVMGPAGQRGAQLCGLQPEATLA